MGRLERANKKGSEEMPALTTKTCEHLHDHGKRLVVNLWSSEEVQRLYMRRKTKGLARSNAAGVAILQASVPHALTTPPTHTTIHRQRWS